MQKFLDNFVDIIHKNLIIIYIFIILIFSTITYFTNYYIPSGSVWDESYHISSAEKYLTGTMFMEAHPPLGKLFIAAGEYIINPNASYDNLNFVATACLSNTPAVIENVVEENGQKKTISQNTIWDSQKKVDRNVNLIDVRKAENKAVDKSKFILTDQIGGDGNNDKILDASFEKNFSFCGYRFFPTLFAAFTPLLLFALLYILTGNKHLSIIGASFWIFENAFLVQSRAAMLDSLQLFLYLCSLIFFAKILQKQFNSGLENAKWFTYNGLKSILDFGFLGLFSGLAIATKHNSAIVLLLPIILIFVEIIKFFDQKVKIDGKMFASFLKLNFVRYTLCLIMLIMAYTGVIFVHGAIGSKIANGATNNAGLYKASSDYIQIIKDRGTINPLNIGTIFADNWNYMQQYHKGVPKLNQTNPSENGSYPANWLMMTKPIRYRWDGSGAESRLLYLLGNPVVWLIGLLGIILTAGLFLNKFFFRNKITNENQFYTVIIFGIIYLAYMLSVFYASSVRVMYLYHYFIGLVTSVIMFILVIHYQFKTALVNEITGFWKDSTFRIYFALILLLGICVAGYILYAPFTYSLPITKEEFALRNWFDFWQLKWER